jgi:hypothetical protein
MLRAQLSDAIVFVGEEVRLGELCRETCSWADFDFSLSQTVSHSAPFTEDLGPLLK